MALLRTVFVPLISCNAIVANPGPKFISLAICGPMVLLVGTVHLLDVGDLVNTPTSAPIVAEALGVLLGQVDLAGDGLDIFLILCRLYQSLSNPLINLLIIFVA